MRLYLLKGPLRKLQEVNSGRVQLYPVGKGRAANDIPCGQDGMPFVHTLPTQSYDVTNVSMYLHCLQNPIKVPYYVPPQLPPIIPNQS